MVDNNKAILPKGNAAISKGDNEELLVHCTEDTEWVFVGDRTLHGKEAVRQWMVETYLEPPKNVVEALIAEGNFVTVTGAITLKDKNGKTDISLYCDIWQFQDGKMAKLKAFVIKS